MARAIAGSLAGKNAKKTGGDDQVALFDDPGPRTDVRSPSDTRAMRELAARLPAHVRLGTSSWHYPGWRGVVWPDEARWNKTRCSQEGLPIYAKHPLFHTIGIDRGFYRPTPEADLARYAAQLPEGFLAASKVYEAHTLDRPRPRDLDPTSTTPPADNPHYLDVESFTQTTIEPYATAFSKHAGPFVLEFAAGATRDVEALAHDLERFLKGVVPRVAAIGPNASISVELRDRKLLDERVIRVIIERGASYCLSFHTVMPTLSQQIRWMDRYGALDAGGAPIVARLMLPPRQRYVERKEALEPFDAIQDVQDLMRRDTVDLVERTAKAGRELFVIVDNKSEGSAPLTVRALAERIADG